MEPLQVDAGVSSHALAQQRESSRRAVVQSAFNPLESLAQLLLEPGAALAFNIAGPGVHSSMRESRSQSAALDRQRSIAHAFAPSAREAAQMMASGFMSSPRPSNFIGAPPSPSPEKKAEPVSQPVAMVAKDGDDAMAFPALDGKEVRVGIVKARQYEEIADGLVTGIKAALNETGVDPENIVESEVPTCFELPLAARFLALSRTVDVVLPVGVLVKEDAADFQVVSQTVANGLMNIGLTVSLPVIHSVLSAETKEKAAELSSGENSLGPQWGKAAVEMALLRQFASGKGKKSFLGFNSAGEEESEKDEGEAKKPSEKKKITF